VGKWKSQGDFQGGLGRRLFHNLILSPGPTLETFSYMAGCQLITHGRIGVITEGGISFLVIRVVSHDATQ
jgi:hypothetical protein